MIYIGVPLKEDISNNKAVIVESIHILFSMILKSIFYTKWALQDIFSEVFNAMFMNYQRMFI